MISTGKLMNAYSGETFETLENQLPPPNCYKPIFKSQLKAANPRLLHLTGGRNDHKPPPRRKEQSGSVFKPVSALGGASPFGSNIYDRQVTQKMKMYANRDLFNNKNGQSAVEPSMYGESPHGYVGYVPRHRIEPSLPPTQALDLKGRTTVPETIGVDLTKREEYSGQVFSRKAHLLVERESGPNVLLNGVEAVAQIPFTSDKIQTDGQTQYWITPAFVDGASYVHQDPTRSGKINADGNLRINPAQVVDGASYVHQDPTRPGKINAGGNLRINHAEGTEYQPTIQPLDLIVKPKPNAEQSVRLAGNPVSETGETLHRVNLKETNKTEIVTQSLPVHAFQSGVFAGQVLPQVPVRDTLKTQDPLPVSAPMYAQSGSVVMTATDVKPTNKTGVTDASFRLNSTARPDEGQLMTNLASIRPTQKYDAEVLPVAALSAVNTGGVLVSTQGLKSTQKMDQMLPTGVVDSHVQSGYLLLDKEISATRRETMPFLPHQPALDGQALGEAIPLQHLTTRQDRGTRLNEYIPDNSKVTEGSGGSGDQLRGDVRQRRERNMYLYTNPDDGTFMNPHIIPSLRLTQRDMTDINDYLNAQ
jgi:hypothetical protein